MQHRNRPRISVTLAQETLGVLRELGADIGIANLGITIDFLVTDYLKQRRVLSQQGLDATLLPRLTQHASRTTP